MDEVLTPDFESLPATSKALTFAHLEQELKNKLKISELTQDILKTLQLFSEKEGFNKAAELIADENSFPGTDTARIGESFSEIFDREIFEKTSILGQFESMMKRFRRYYVFEGIVDFRRKNIELIPGTAFREALVNSLVHRRWDFESHTGDAFGPEVERDAFGFQQGLVLAHEAGVGLSEDGFKVLHGERAKLHADGKAPLQLGDQVAGLGQVKGAGGDEEDVVGFDHAVFGADDGT